ncbi:MAG: UDP-N-acetylmuramoyl-L-alanyl-D-glutamate--2,6-diaminopimelate ligase [Burkholderiales bacterium]|nr:UDP-N-acetylmuramoyl-L-alanyl-D-glutamate--2,6-diaminopimelate ligase [Burkholderiales bacterium]
MSSVANGAGGHLARLGAQAQGVLAALRRAGVAVTGLSADTRALGAGDVFLAYPGERADGRRFIAQAIAEGAAAVLWEREGFAWDGAWRLPNLPVEHLRALAGPLAAEVYGHPSERLWTIGVTGTNGKTSTSQWIAQALAARATRTAVIGTLGLGFPGALEPALNTTPDAILLQRALARFADAGAQAVAIEVSSIGLDQGRVNGVAFDVALFTNLSRDHLDYHGSMEAYAQAKMRLFDSPGLEHAVLNLDDALGVRIAQHLAGSGVARVGYSIGDGAARRSGLARWLEAHDVRFGDGGLAFALASSWGDAVVEAPLVGRFNVANVLGVLGVLLVSGVPLAAAARLARDFEPVVGRMQRLGGAGRPTVVIDYAHTPDALDKVLGAVADAARARGGRLVCVFGCGGERDRGKRPLMGEAASRHADFVIVTSDNPRGEDPGAIIAEILPGVAVPHRAVVDRREAIRAAVAEASPDDVIVLAGKGHEPYQEIGGERIPFSDAEEARHALEARP